jgi:hypothetical protein
MCINAQKDPILWEDIIKMELLFEQNTDVKRRGSREELLPELGEHFTSALNVRIV